MVAPLSRSVPFKTPAASKHQGRNCNCKVTSDPEKDFVLAEFTVEGAIGLITKKVMIPRAESAFGYVQEFDAAMALHVFTFEGDEL